MTFRYKDEIDPEGRSQFGLVAEDVENVSPDLIVRDKEGKPYSVRYDQVNAMLLNEFLQEHRRIEELKSAMVQQRKDFEAAIARQQKQSETLVARLNEQEIQIQKLNAQVLTDKSWPKIPEPGIEQPRPIPSKGEAIGSRAARFLFNGGLKRRIAPILRILKTGRFALP